MKEIRRGIKSAVGMIVIAKSKVEILRAAEGGAVTYETQGAFGDVSRLVLPEVIEDLDSAIKEIWEAIGTAAEGQGVSRG